MGVRRVYESSNPVLTCRVEAATGESQVDLPRVLVSQLMISQETRLSAEMEFMMRVGTMMTYTQS
jgi:hypothetical protein